MGTAYKHTRSVPARHNPLSFTSIILNLYLHPLVVQARLLAAVRVTAADAGHLVELLQYLDSISKTGTSACDSSLPIVYHIMRWVRFFPRPLRFAVLRLFMSEKILISCPRKSTCLGIDV